MNNKTIGLIATATALVATVGTVGWQVADKEVQVAVDGSTTTVHTFGDTVADALAANNITVGEHDTVVPSVNSSIKDGTMVTVNYGRPLTITLDGKKTTLWTTAKNVDSALGQLGVIEPGTKLSVSRSTPLGREGLALTAVSPKQVTLTEAGKKRTVKTTALTVGELLKEQKLTVGRNDKLTPAAKTAIKEKLSVSLQRVGNKTETTTEKVEHETERTRTATLDEGTTRTTVEGKDGVVTKTWQVTVVDGKPAKRSLVKEEVTTKPVTEQILVGTREEAPEESTPKTRSEDTSRSEDSSARETSGESTSATRAASSRPSRSAASSAPVSKPTATASSKPRATASSKPTTRATSEPTREASSSSAGLNTANQAMWERIAQCESSGNWSINTGNGYYGGLQFDRQTWLGAGGGAYAPTANLASKAEQITIANKVYAQRGLQPWGCAHAA